MAELIIRAMQESDIPAIMEIERSSFSTPWSEISFLNEIYKKYGIAKVSVFDGKLIGYSCVNYVLHEAHILNLAVHQDFRKRGVGTILMHEIVRELKMKECVFMYLEVRVSNTGAQAFYERFGFTAESRRKKYYAHPDEDALLMMGRI
jgi:[ribosomal protein S18]-alanine N-acetyltransferase